MRRNEVWWANLPNPMGRRPVLLLSRDESYRARNAVMIAQITTKVRDLPVEVGLNKEDGLSKKCVVNLDTISTIKKHFLSERICSLRIDKINKVNKAIKFALDLE